MLGHSQILNKQYLINKIDYIGATQRVASIFHRSRNGVRDDSKFSLAPWGEGVRRTGEGS